MTSTPPDRMTRDFERDVHCLFGLPVDNLTLASTKVLLRERVTQEGNTVLSTINTNWVVQSFSDPEFREAIINSDLVTIDGVPLLWLARLLGCPMQEPVSGSTLIDALLEEETGQPPLTIFLFGGEGEAAEQAMGRINQRGGGLQAVGALNPGFGNIEELSTDAIIDTINSVKPDILLVALGAKKGTQWIERNRHQLNAKIISHLGATINFLAGTIKRAPRFMQHYGLEWVWRIIQEPKLFTRYAKDGFIVLRTIAGRFFLWLQYRIWKKKYCHLPIDTVPTRWEEKKVMFFSFGKNLQVTKNCSLWQFFNDSEHANVTNITLDFQKTVFMDSAFLGQLLLFLQKQKQSGHKINFIHCGHGPAKMLRLFDF